MSAIADAIATTLGIIGIYGVISYTVPPLVRLARQSRIQSRLLLVVTHSRPNCITMHSDFQFALVPGGQRTNVRRKIMKFKMTGAAGLVGAFVAGMVVATALGGGMARARTAAHEQQVKVERVITPTVTDEDIALLRRDLRAVKMQVIGQNMSLSEEEGQKFWPIYNHYVRDLQVVNDQKYALLKQYAEMWATMSDQDAMIYVRRWFEVDAQVQALRLKYVPTVAQVLPGRKAATFFQLDRRLNMIIDLQLFSQIPLAHPKE
jgi:hypothetical protein